MQPYFSLLIEGVDMTETINDRLVSLSVQDHIGLVNDTFSITIDDRPDKDGQDLPIPPHGATIDIELGYRKGDGLVSPFDGLKKLGRFELDEVQLTKGDNGRAMVLTGRATDTNYSFIKKPRSDGGRWRNVTLAYLAESIAVRNGFIPRIHDDLKNIPIWTNQTNRSDSDFLTELATNYGCVMKVQEKCLYFAPSDKLTEVLLPDLVPDTVHVNETDGMGYKFTWQGRSNFTGVKAKYKSKDTAASNEVTSQVITEHPDAAECWFTLTEEFTSLTEAQMAADSRKRQLDYQRATLSIECIGYPLLMSGAILMLGEDFRTGIPKEWRITSVTHSFDDGGYTSSLEAEVRDAKVLNYLPQQAGGESIQQRDINLSINPIN